MKMELKGTSLAEDTNNKITFYRFVLIHFNVLCNWTIELNKIKRKNKLFIDFLFSFIKFIKLQNERIV